MSEAEAVFGPPAWCPWHHVGPSKDNKALPKSKRAYFDGLPGKVQLKCGEFADVLLLQPNEVHEVFGALPGRSTVLDELRCRAKGLLRPASPASPSEPPRPRSAWDSRQDEGVPGERAVTPASRGTPSGLSAKTTPEPELKFSDGRLLPTSWRVVAQWGLRGTAGVPGLGSASGGSCSSSPSKPPKSRAAASPSPGPGNEDFKRQRSKSRGVQAFQGGDLPAELEFKRFREWCEAKHGHLVHLWRKLDKDGSMTLHKSEFLKGLKDLAYGGDAEKLWSFLDSDTTGIVTFLEFTPEHALDLARFKQWAEETFGSFRATFHALDTDHSGRVTFAEFVEACKDKGLPAHLLECATTLFMILDGDHHGRGGHLTEDSLLFLDKWQCPPYLWERPDFEAKERFKSMLVKRHHGNALLAWRKALDKDASMRVSYDEFVITCKSLARMRLDVPAGPAVTAVFCAFDEDRSGWFSLRNWDEDAYAALRAFATWAKHKSGKVSSCIRTITQGEGKFANWAAFRQGTKDSGLSNSDLPYVFEALGLTKAGHICPVDVAFLDRWDPDAEEKEELVWQGITAKRLSAF